jgi:heme oxygenase
VTKAASALELIRHSTALAHRALEAKLVVAQDAAGEAEYTRYLGAVLGWLEPLEAALWSWPWPEPWFALPRQGKVRWVESDLSARGFSSAKLAALPRQRVLPPLDSEAGRFGVAYVIEGAQLGGQVLLRRLGPRVAPLPTRWLVGYGRNNSVMWREFLGALSAHVREPAQAEAAALSARATFELVHAWFQARGVA